MKLRILLFILTCTLAQTTLVSAQISVRSELSHDEFVTAGQRYSGTIEVRNESDVMQEVRLYQTDYVFQADGSNDFGAPGATVRSNANWVELGMSSLQIPPQQLINIPYSVQVPDDEALEGSYWSMIMVESVPDAPKPSANSEKKTFGISQVTRYGIQVASHITGTGNSDLAIMDTQLVKTDSGDSQLHLSIVNKGDLMVRPDVWIEVYDVEGNPVGRRDGFKNRIYPGTSVRQQVVLGSLPNGQYRALVIMDAGSEEVYGAEYTLAVE